MTSVSRKIKTGHSLRRRLLVSTMTAVVLAALLQALSAYRGALQQADEMFDYHLQQMAYSLRGGPALGTPFLEDPRDSDSGYVIQIWGPNGVQLFRSGRTALPPRAVLGFSDVQLQGTQYRVYSLQTAYQTIQIAQDMSARTARARALAFRAMLPMALMAPLLLLILWWVIRRSLLPLERTRQQVASRAADDLSALPQVGLPDEVMPLVRELNLLFARVQTAFDAQKSFVAHAAHELRSPLTALKVQAQALSRAPDETTRTLAVTRLNQGIERSIQLMNQLLLLARQGADDPIGADGPPQDLAAITQRALTDALVQAQLAQVDLQSGELAPASIRCDGDALLILLRNLLENAIKYTPAGGHVTVELDRVDPGYVKLLVQDSGPGIPTPERARVFEPFYRSPDSVATGTGLGLAIVKAIAERHHATVRLGESPTLGGLRVEVRFPVVQPR
jgi:two-component system OmpR family sensor kinase